MGAERAPSAVVAHVSETMAKNERGLGTGAVHEGTQKKNIPTLRSTTPTACDA